MVTLTPSRYTLVDTLRGFALLLMLLFHVQLRIPFQETALLGELPREVWSFWFMSGIPSMRVFFVISGFLITHRALRRWGDLTAVRVAEFYLLRFARIAPLLLLLVTVLSVLHFLELEHYTIHPQRASYTRTLFAALAFHMNWLEGQVGFLATSWGVLWSLSVEEVFYMAFPWIGILTFRRWQIYGVFAAFVILAPFYRAHTAINPIWSGRAYLSCMDAIACGCICALVLDHYRLSPGARRCAGISGGVTLVLLLVFKTSAPLRYMSSLYLYETLLQLSTVLLLCYCAQNFAPRWQISLLWPLTVLGKNSFEIYLTHMFVVFFGFDLYRAMNPSDGGRFAILGTVLILSGALGELVRRNFSDPMNLFIRNRLRKT